MTAANGPYQIEWARPAIRALERLPEQAASAAIEFIYGPLAEAPRRVGHALRFDLEGLQSARRGDHRIAYRTADKEHRVIIEAIAHRGDLYRAR